MADYILAIDQGTTGTTALIVDEQIQIRAQVSQEFPQIFPQPGWVEHNPEAIWTSTIQTIERALNEAGISGPDIAAIGITNQRETTVIWDRDTSKPLYNAIVWQDRRGAEQCKRLQNDGLEALYRDRSGLILDPYFSGTKVSWILDQVDRDRTRAKSGKLAFGTIDTYLVWKLTGGREHLSDVSNASRTLLYNLNTMSWDEELSEPLNIPIEILPEIRASSADFGVTRSVPGLPDGIPICGIAGDQQAALFGQACFNEGDAKCTYGTGAFLLVNTGHVPVKTQGHTLTTVAWQLSGKTTYALEGSAFIAGAAVQWLRDGLGIIRSAGEVESLAASVPDSGGVIFVPALAGLGAPAWRPEARGVITGLTRGSTAAHLARATLDGIAQSIGDLAEAMAEDWGKPLTSFKVDGGATNNDLLLTIQADILGMPIVRPTIIETTGLGAAFLAGLHVGIWSSPADIARSWTPEKTFTPAISASLREERKNLWRQALNKA